MKLSLRISRSVFIAISVILTIWALIFYYQMIGEINDETDDALENYAEYLIQRSLTDSIFTSSGDGSNNSYFFEKIDPQTASQIPHIKYSDAEMYIASQYETEPARILKTVFKNEENEYYLLTIYTPTIEKDDLKETILYSIIFLYFILLITIILINIFIYRHNLKPFYKVLHWLSEYQLGEKNPPLDNPTKITEYQQLNHEITKYVTRTEMAFEEQKMFISKASHELQTPIAVCTNRLEMLVNQTTLTEEQIIEIMKTQHTLAYMSKLNKTLLFLTKIYNNQFQETKNVDWGVFIHNLISDFEMAYSYLNISIQITEKEKFKTKINETLATSLLSNLISNAYRYNYAGGKIEICILGEKITISNTGKEQSLDKKMIFQPYFHEKSNSESTGLGLAIAEAICKNNSLSIDYNYSQKIHNFIIQKK